MAFTLLTIGFCMGVFTVILYDLCCLATNMKREESEDGTD